MGLDCEMQIPVPIHQNLWLLGLCGQTGGKWLMPTKNNSDGKELREELDATMVELSMRKNCLC